MQISDSIILYELLTISIPKDFEEFGDEILEKCSRLLGAKKAALILKVDNLQKPILLGFSSEREAIKTIERAEMKLRGNEFLHKFNSGIFYIEKPNKISCNERRIVMSFAKRVEEISEHIVLEKRKIELEKMKVLLKSIPDAVIVVSKDGVIEDINNTFIRVSSYAPHEVIGRKIYELDCFDSESKDRLKKVVESWNEKIEVKIIDKYFELNAAKIEETDKFVLVMRDVTKLKELMKNYENSLIRLTTLIDCLRSIVYFKDCEGRYTLVNKTYAKFLGKDKKELIGKKDEEILPPYLAKECTGTDEEAIKSRRPITFERVVDIKGEKRFFEGYKVPIYNNRGELIGIVGVIRDITDRKSLEELKRFRTLMDFSRDAIFLTDKDCRIVDVNETACNWTGKKKEELIGKRIDRFIIGDWCKNSFEGLIPETNLVVSVNVREAKFSGKIYRVIAVRDVTELKKTQKKVEEMYKQLRLLNKILRHDIGNSLAIMSGYLEIFKDTGNYEFLNKIEERLNICYDLIRTVRDIEEVLSRSKGSEQIKLKDVILNEVEKVKNLENVSVSVDFSKCEDVKILADNMVHSVIENILNNAVFHNTKQVKKIEITISCSKDFVEIRISDNGPGIPDSIKEKIFEEGFKGLETGRTGMGLYLVKTLMEKYGGKVWVEDNKPEGSVFVLRFRRRANNF